MKRMLLWLVLCCVCLVGKMDWPFTPWQRVSQTPILSPRAGRFDSAGAFNPAVIRRGSEIVMLYRAQDGAGTSTIGYATSKDGIHFVRWPRPVRTGGQYKNGGVEDPRLVRIDNSFYLTYTGYNRVDAQLCLAKSDDSSMDAIGRHHSRE